MFRTDSQRRVGLPPLLTVSEEGRDGERETETETETETERKGFCFFCSVTAWPLTTLDDIVCLFTIGSTVQFWIMLFISGRPQLIRLLQL